MSSRPGFEGKEKNHPSSPVTKIAQPKVLGIANTPTIIKPSLLLDDGLVHCFVNDIAHLRKIRKASQLSNSSSNSIALSPVSKKMSKKSPARCEANAFAQISSMSIPEFLKLVVTCTVKEKRTAIENITYSIREWLANQYQVNGQGVYPREEKLIKFQQKSSQCLLFWLTLQPLPVFILSLGQNGQPSSNHGRVNVGLQSQQILDQIIQTNEGKDMILQSKSEDMQNRSKILTETCNGLREGKNIIVASNGRVNEVVDSDLPNEERLEAVGRELMFHIEIVIDALVKSHQLASRSKFVVRRILKGESITENVIDQLDPQLVSLLVNKLGILSIIRRGRKFKLICNDFSS